MAHNMRLRVYVRETHRGCSNYPTWVNNPQVQLWVRGDQPTKLFICLNQRDGLEYGQKREYKSIGLALHANGTAVSKQHSNERCRLWHSQYQTPF
jgi:hypothetical protein